MSKVSLPRNNLLVQATRSIEGGVRFREQRCTCTKPSMLVRRRDSRH
jgi:hypothetical protein